jgi:AraC-like DNA-binding protein
MKIRIVSLNKSLSLKSNDTLDFPKGKQNYSLFLFKSEALVKSNAGINDVNAGDCILISPSTSIFVKPKKEAVAYDLIEFKGSDATRLVSQVGFELNSVCSPVQIYFVDALMDKITKECNANDLLWERVIASSLDELLTKLVRFSKQDFVLSMPDHAQRLRELRSEVHENFSKHWTIGNMAEMMGLSSSRFASLYKQVFNTSPTEDLIKTRIDQSKKMLSATKVSVKKVSAACGFESVHYFHRAFKKRMNITPKHFQNHMLSMKGSIPSQEDNSSLDALSLSSDFSGTMEIINGELVFHGSGTAWNNFIGYDVKELRDKPFINFISPEDLDVATETINHIVQGNNVFDVAVSLTRKDGEPVGIEFSAVSKGDTWFWFAKKQLVEA